MAGRIYVDQESLAQMSVQLGRIARELSGVRSSVQEVVAVVENPQIAGAMEKFDSSWRRHREHLVTSLEDGQRLTASAADAYSNLDTSMAESIKLRGAGQATPAGVPGETP